MLPNGQCMRRLLGAGFAYCYSVGLDLSLVAKAVTSDDGVYIVLAPALFNYYFPRR